MMQKNGLNLDTLKAYYEVSNYTRASYFIYKGIADAIKIGRSGIKGAGASSIDATFSIFDVIFPLMSVYICVHDTIFADTLS